MEKKGKIFVIYHKIGNIIKSDIYTPIQVGRYFSKIDLGIMSDDIGENISKKNKNYCEFTAMYRVRKNYDLSNIDYVGFCHYRRFLSTKFKYRLQEKIIKPTIDFIRYIFGSKTTKLINWTIKILKSKKHTTKIYYEDKEIIQDKDIKKYLKKYDFIVGQKRKNFKNLSIEEEYSKSAQKDDFEKMKEIVSKKHNINIEKINNIFKEKKQYAYNIFITVPEKFKKYMEWLFKVLFELEKELPISKDPYQARALGFLGERMFHLYIRINNFKIAEIPFKYKINEY